MHCSLYALPVGNSSTLVLLLYCNDSSFALTYYIVATTCRCFLTLKLLVVTIDAQWEGLGDVGLARYEPALRPPCLTIMVLSYSSW